MISATNDISEVTRNREYKMAKTLSMVVGSFIICWLPMTISYTVFALKEEKFSGEILDVLSVMSHFNSVIDPLIYAFRIKDVRETMKSFLRCGKPRTHPQGLSSFEQKSISNNI